MSAAAPVYTYESSVKGTRKEFDTSAAINILLMKLVGETIGIKDAVQWYTEALEIDQLYQSMPFVQEEKEEEK